MADHVICVRRIKNGVFDPEPSQPGLARLLTVPSDAADISTDHETQTKRAWTEAVIAEGKTGTSEHSGGPVGDIVVYVHGFNTRTKVMLERHRKIKKHLKAAGFKGAVVSFDWPSDNKAINYLEDRRDAKTSAIKLVDHGVRRFLEYQTADCEINVHILAHSMGAYVVREAFDDADDVAKIASKSWSVSQVMLLSGDISASSMREGNPKSSSLYRHCVRLTNYFNPYDEVLKLSNVKRIGISPRVGRVGLPHPAPEKAVNVNTGPYFNANYKNDDFIGHYWYFDDAGFMKDVYATIKGDVDRKAIADRETDGDGGLAIRADA